MRWPWMLRRTHERRRAVWEELRLIERTAYLLELERRRACERAARELEGQR